MKGIKYVRLMFVAFLVTTMLCGCGNSGKKAWDSGIIENVSHGGTFVGYVSVYTIDWQEGTKSRSSEQYRVYKKNDGTYIVDYEGDNCIIKKANKPYGTGTYALKYKIDYNHYIEDIPTSY